MKSSTIRIAILESDHNLGKEYEKSIRAVEDYMLTGTYNSFYNARKTLGVDDPDIILLDIDLPGFDGMDEIPAIKELCPRSQIIMLAAFEDEDQIFRALANGASGYLIKDPQFSGIVESIREVSNGGGALSPSVGHIVIKSFQKNENSPLTKRETQILEMIGAAKNRKEIADQLFINTATVKWHLKNIYRKLQVNSKSHAIKEARRYRLI